MDTNNSRRRKRKLNIYFILLIFLFTSCIKNGERKNSDYKEYKIEINDTEFIKLMYFKGKLIDSSRYKDSHKIGLNKVVNLEKDEYAYLEYNNEGEMTGLSKFFYPNGNLCCYGKFINGKKIGVWEFYDVDKNISSFEYYPNPDETNFLIKYDKDSSVMATMGLPIRSIVAYPDTIVNVNDSVFTQTIVLTPPSVHINLKGEIINSKSGKTLSYTSLINENDSIFYLKLIPKTKGEYELIHYWTLFGHNGVRLDSGQLTLNLYVN